MTTTLGLYCYYDSLHTKSLQLCLTLCHPVDCSLPGSSVHGILKARILEWCHAFLQGIFPTQGSNPYLLCLLHWQAGSSPLAPPGKSHRPRKRMNIHRRYQDLCWCRYSKGRKEGTSNQNSLAVKSVALANCIGMGATVIQVPQRALVCWLLPNITT